MKYLKIIKSTRGFSLMEILIVISLMAVVGSIVVGQLVTRLNEGQVNTAKIQINSFKTLLEDYKRYCGIYPTSEQGLDALVKKPSVGQDCPSYPAGGFIQDGKIPKDPWDMDYVYESADGGKTYLITSYGSDKRPDGDGFAKDIKSNDL